MGWNKTSWDNVIGNDSVKQIIPSGGSFTGNVGCNSAYKYITVAIKTVVVFGATPDGDAKVKVFSLDCRGANEPDTVPIYSQDIKAVAGTEQIITIPNLDVSALDSLSVEVINNDTTDDISVWVSFKAGHSIDLLQSIDEKIRISSTDLNNNYLIDKLYGTSNVITLSKQDDGGNESIVINAENAIAQWNADKLKGKLIDDADIGNNKALIYNSSSGNLEYVDPSVGADTFKVKISGNDNTTDYLSSKLVGTTDKITLTEVNDGGDETLQISIGTNVFDKSYDDLDDISNGSNYGRVKNTELLDGQVSQVRAVTNTSDVTGDQIYTHISSTGDPHDMQANQVTADISNFDGYLSGSDITVQAALETLDDHSHIATDVTDFDTEVSNNTDVSANTTARNQVKISANDTVDDYLLNKVIGTTNKITVTEVNDGGDEDLQIDIGTDIFDKVVDNLDAISDGTTYGKVLNTELESGQLSQVRAVTNTSDVTGDQIYTHISSTGDPHDMQANQVTADISNFDGYLSGSDTTVQAALETLDDHSHIATDVTDFDTEVSNNTDVSANTTARNQVKISANDTTDDYLLNKVIGTTNKITVTEVNDAGDEDLQIDIGTDVFDKVVDNLDAISDGTTYGKVLNTELESGQVS